MRNSSQIVFNSQIISIVSLPTRAFLRLIIGIVLRFITNSLFQFLLYENLSGFSIPLPLSRMKNKTVSGTNPMRKLHTFWGNKLMKLKKTKTTTKID